MIAIYEDAAGSVYLERDGETWNLGPADRYTDGSASECAEGWHNGSWHPSDHNSQPHATTDSLVLIGTWTPEVGLVVIFNGSADVVAGAAGKRFLGVKSETTEIVVRFTVPADKADTLTPVIGDMIKAVAPGLTDLGGTVTVTEDGREVEL
jgi:hypothetical protein